MHPASSTCGPQPRPVACPPHPQQMGETPLIRCAHNGHFQTVKFLVEQGADVNAVDMVGPQERQSRWVGQGARARWAGFGCGTADTKRSRGRAGKLAGESGHGCECGGHDGCFNQPDQRCPNHRTCRATTARCIGRRCAAMVRVFGCRSTLQPQPATLCGSGSRGVAEQEVSAARPARNHSSRMPAGLVCASPAPDRGCNPVPMCSRDRQVPAAAGRGPAPSQQAGQGGLRWHLSFNIARMV